MGRQGQGLPWPVGGGEMGARHPGAILPHQALLVHVWGDEYAHDTHYLKVFMHRLRRKLGDTAGHPRFIQACRGIGYRFVATT